MHAGTCWFAWYSSTVGTDLFAAAIHTANAGLSEVCESSHSRTLMLSLNPYHAFHDMPVAPEIVCHTGQDNVTFPRVFIVRKAL